MRNKPQVPLQQQFPSVHNNATVLAFGSFDPLHEGHLFFLKQAKSFGKKLVVVVARDTTIKSIKEHKPFQAEDVRVSKLKKHSFIDQVILGDSDYKSYELLKKIDFDVLAMGYDQQPGDLEAQKILQDIGKGHVAIRRIEPYKPHLYKSSIVKGEV